MPHFSHLKKTVDVERCFCKKKILRILSNIFYPLFSGGKPDGLGPGTRVPPEDPGPTVQGPLWGSPHKVVFYIIRTLKGTVSRDGYSFWRSKHFNKFFLCMRWWFSRSFNKFSLPEQFINFLFTSLKFLTNFKNAYWNPPQKSLLCDWSMFYIADLSLAAGKCTRINLS